MLSNSDEGNKNSNNPKYIIKSFMQQTRQTLSHQDLRVLDLCQTCSHAAAWERWVPQDLCNKILYFSTHNEQFYTKSEEKEILQSLLTLQIGQRCFCTEVQFLDRSKLIAIFVLPWNALWCFSQREEAEVVDWRKQTRCTSLQRWFSH